MAKHDKYHPDYSKLYPGIESRPEILAVLKQSDRKMKYIEVDLKTERPVYSKKLAASYSGPAGRIPLNGCVKMNTSSLPLMILPWKKNWPTRICSSGFGTPWGSWSMTRRP